MEKGLSATVPESGQLTHRIRELEVRNEVLEDVLEAARRMLQTRTTLDNRLMKELDRAVLAAESQK